MQPLSVVKRQPCADPLLRLGDESIDFRIDLLVIRAASRRPLVSHVPFSVPSVSVPFLGSETAGNARGVPRGSGAGPCRSARRDRPRLTATPVDRCRPKPGVSSSRRSEEVEPLCCPRCGHEMKIISLIHEPDVIECILRHLGSRKQHPGPLEAKTKAPAGGPVVFEDFDDGWPGYEEPVII
jgi:hypothetical protein